jgi:hypothetical protein
VMEWVKEVNHFNCQFVFKPSPDALVNKDLGGSYYEGAKPIVEYLIGKAGTRLAAWLEKIVALTRGLDEHDQHIFQKIEF